jgi:xylulokinase
LHRAVLEGVAFASRRNIQIMEDRGSRLQQMIAIAGGAKTRLWLEIKASIYRCPILIPSEPEGGVLGCATLAGLGAGLFASLSDATAKLVHYDSEVLPNPDWVDRYQRMQALFDDLYTQNEQNWDRFTQL